MIFSLILAILATNNVYAIEFFPLVATNPDWAKTQQGFIGEPIIFQHTTLNDNFEPLDFDLLFTTRLPDDTIVDNKTIPVHLNPNETKTVTYQFVPIKEGNFITGVSSEVYPLGESITFSVLDASKNYKRETILIQTIPSQKSCSQVCVNQSETTVNVGSVVEWLNESPNTQTIQTGIYKEDTKGISFSSDNRLVGKIEPESKFPFLFLEQGDYKYYFSDHRFLQYAGIIHVVSNNLGAESKKEILILVENYVRKAYYTGENITSAIFDHNTGSIIFETGANAKVDLKAPKIFNIGPGLFILKNGEEVDAVKNVDECFNYATLETQEPAKIEFVFASWPEFTEQVENCETFIVPPLKQIKLGIEPSKVVCDDSLNLLLKPTEFTSAVCVTDSTYQKLSSRGWSLVGIWNDEK